MLSSLNTALSGLNASRVAVENVSNNIANEHTAGYKRRSVQLNEVTGLDSQIYGRGVTTGGAVRTTSQFMYDNIMQENAKKNYFLTKSRMLGDVESVFKQTADSGFSNDLNRYFKAVENLRSNPNSQVYKTDLKNQGAIVVDTLNRLYDGIEAQEKLSEKSLKLDVTRVNGLLNEMGKINNQLSKSTQASNVLLDRRDKLEKELGTYVDIEVDRTSDDYELRIGGKVALRYGDNVRSFTVTTDDIKQNDKFLKDDGQTSSLNFNTDNSFNNNDVIRYKFDNNIEVTLEVGETVMIDGVANVADNDNYIRLLSHKINNTPELKDKITAFNGTYKVDADGKKITNDSKDNYLNIESNTPGTKGRFEGRVVIEEYSSLPRELGNLTSKNTTFKDDYQSEIGSSEISVKLFDKEVKIKSGSIAAHIENLQTDSGANKFQDYKNKLDQFAKTLSDLTSEYIKNDDGTYISGEMTIDSHLKTNGTSIDKKTNYIGNPTGADPRPNGLFSGSSVRSLKFNKDVVSYLDQNKLDYLAKMQFKSDISFKDGVQGKLTPDGQLEDTDATSFTDFFQRLTVDVSKNKESNDFLLETQTTVIHSLEQTYERIVKVDKDEEMLDLVKFQATYSANAKVISAIDEMIQVMLGLKR